jgi:hypothetical protein
MATLQELVDRARVYLDDDHEDDNGWLSEESWIRLANVEYAQLYRRWCRQGLISPAWTDAAFTGYTTTVSGVLATIGVAEDLGSGEYRLLTPAQSVFGRSPTYGYTTGKSAHWFATGTADQLVYTLEPRDSGSYFVRYLPTVTPADALEDSLSIPFGADERMVLGLARRAKLKEGAASALLERLIMEADAELNFAAFGRANDDSPRVRRTNRSHEAYQAGYFPTNPAAYRYI